MAITAAAVGALSALAIISAVLFGYHRGRTSQVGHARLVDGDRLLADAALWRRRANAMGAFLRKLGYVVHEIEDPETAQVRYQATLLPSQRQAPAQAGVAIPRPPAAPELN